MATPAETHFTSPQVVTRKREEVDMGSVTVIVPESQYIIGGEYKDEPDLVIEVRHAVDSDGSDVSASVAQRIASILAGA